MKLTRNGAIWTDENGTPYLWDDAEWQFINSRTGEIVEVEDRISEDVVVVA